MFGSLLLSLLLLLSVMEFIEKYARVDASEDEDDSVVGGDEVTTCSNAEFVDDHEETNIQG